jgi:hypothetical protein
MDHAKPWEGQTDPDFARLVGTARAMKARQEIASPGLTPERLLKLLQEVERNTALTAAEQRLMADLQGAGVGNSSPVPVPAAEARDTGTAAAAFLYGRRSSRRRR